MPANLRNQWIHEAFPELKNSSKSIYIRLWYIWPVYVHVHRFILESFIFFEVADEIGGQRNGAVGNGANYNSDYREARNWNAQQQRDNATAASSKNQSNREASISSLGPFVTQPCTMHVSSCSMQVIGIASLDYPSPNRTKMVGSPAIATSSFRLLVWEGEQS